MKNFKQRLTSYLTVLLSTAALFGTASCSDNDDNKTPGGGDDIAATSITVMPTSTTLEVGGTQPLTVTVLPTNATNKDFTLESSDSAIATVANYTVTAVGVGTATITAKLGTLTPATCQITVTEKTTGGGEEEYEIVEVKNITQGEMGYYGQVYEGVTTDYANWMLILAGSGYDLDSEDGTGPLVQIELNTASSATKDITPGTYTISEDFVAFSCIPAFVQEEETGDYLYGTWYFNEDLEGAFGATSGTVTISKSGSNYTVVFDFADDDYMGKFKGTYTGPLSYYDYTATGASAVAAKKTAMKQNKQSLTQVKRFALRK